MLYYSGLLCLTMCLGACISGKSQLSSGKNSYREDLSLVRPKYGASGEVSGTALSGNSNSKSAVAPQKDITKLLNSRLDTLSVRNKRLKLAQGFRVLVYTGNSSEEMKKVKLKLRTLLNETPVYDEFKQPTFRVKAGDCFSRLEAHYILKKIQRDYPNAIVVPDQIYISKEQ